MIPNVTQIQPTSSRKQNQKKKEKTGKKGEFEKILAEETVNPVKGRSPGGSDK